LEMGGGGGGALEMLPAGEPNAVPTHRTEKTYFMSMITFEKIFKHFKTYTLKGLYLKN